MTEHRFTPLPVRMIQGKRTSGRSTTWQTKCIFDEGEDYAAFLGLSPDKATREDLHAYLLQMTDGSAASRTVLRAAALSK